MTDIPLFLQFEGDPRIEMVTLREDARVADVRARAVALGFPALADALVFHQGDDQPLDEKRSLKAQKVAQKDRLCLHHCRQLHVTIRFAGEDKQHPFPASATIAEVKAWYVDKIDMPEKDASEHVLQVAGTEDRPSPDVMIGSLKSEQCRIALSLVPIKRVEG